MKNFVYYIIAPCILIISLSVGCNSDDLDEGQEEEFLSAQIDGADFMVDRSLGAISCKKYLNDYGGIDLLVNVETNNGEHMEFYIANYIGANNYTFNNIFNRNSMKYGIVYPLGDWFASVEKEEVQPTTAYLEVIEDNGNYIRGNFEFEAYNMEDNTIKLINNGNFKIASGLE